MGLLKRYSLLRLHNGGRALCHLLLPLLCPLLILLLLRLLCQRLSHYRLLHHLRLNLRLLLMLHSFRLHSNVHGQLLQALLEGGDVVVGVEGGGGAVE